MARVALTTLGCKVNWADGEGLIRQFAAMGLEIVSFDSVADAYIVNSCTVTEVADRQSRQIIRRAGRLNPKAFVIATGCMAQLGGQIPEVDAVFGTHDHREVVEYLRKLFPDPCPPFPVPQSRARAFLKIQDGCDRACAYCIVPRARGPAKSVPPAEVIDACMTEARHHREIILTGIDIGQYGSDLKQYTSLTQLLGTITKLHGVPRLRISSVDPTVIDDEFVGMFSNSDKICRHVHLSIQSASNSVIERMGRAYTARDISDAVLKLFRAVPDIAITGDIIAGFPGETESEHQETVSLIRDLPFASLHVFPYSARKETRAAGMDGHIELHVKRERAAYLRGLARMHRERFLKGLVGKSLEVIVTSRGPDADGLVYGFSDNAVSVALPLGFVDYAGAGIATVTKVNKLKVFGTWDSQEKKKISSSVSRSASDTSSNGASI